MKALVKQYRNLKLTVYKLQNKYRLVVQMDSKPIFRNPNSEDSILICLEIFNQWLTNEYSKEDR